MPEDGPLVGSQRRDVVGPEDLVGAAPAETQGGADTVTSRAGRSHAVLGGLVVAEPRSQVQAGPGLSTGYVGYVDVSRHREGDVRNVPVIPKTR